MDDFDRLFLESVPLIDVRSPGEFQAGHFPGSVNLPILTDDERKEIGTLYKTQGPDAALSLGHRRVAGSIREERIRSWVEFIEKHPDARLYCARGGLRSGIAASWIAEAGSRVIRIPGGYKALRNHLLQRMPERIRELSFRIIGGKTGCGKTTFLKESGLPHIDLEELANHKGSSFGDMGPQPSQAVFENALIIELMKQDASRPVLLEDESIMIGSITLPPALHSRMKESPLWILEAPLQERLENIARDYLGPRLAADPSPPRMTESFFLGGLSRIERKLGGKRKSEIEDMIREAFRHPASLSWERHYGWIAALLEDYYDPFYERGLLRSKFRIAGHGSKNELASRLSLS